MCDVEGSGVEDCKEDRHCCEQSTCYKQYNPATLTDLIICDCLMPASSVPRVSPPTSSMMSTSLSSPGLRLCDRPPRLSSPRSDLRGDLENNKIIIYLTLCDQWHIICASGWRSNYILAPPFHDVQTTNLSSKKTDLDLLRRALLGKRSCQFYRLGV